MANLVAIVYPDQHRAAEEAEAKFQPMLDEANKSA
jgi:hypothetical protein